MLISCLPQVECLEAYLRLNRAAGECTWRIAYVAAKEGIYVISFSFRVVPKGQARIRTQMSAGLEREHLDRAVAAFAKVGRQLDVIS